MIIRINLSYSSCVSQVNFESKNPESGQQDDDDNDTYIIEKAKPNKSFVITEIISNYMNYHLKFDSNNSNITFS